MKKLRIDKASGESRMWLTILLLLVFVAVLSVVLLTFLFLGSGRRLEMPMQWTNQRMAFNSAEQSAMQSQKAFTADLCVGGDNVALEGVSISDNENAALMSLDDRAVVFSRNMYERVYPASITKIMTAILALKSGKMGDTVTINWQDLELESGSQVVGFRIGDVVTMEALLRGLLVHSGNDAAQAIARHVGGTQEKFVAMMNEELLNLGCTGSHFTNPTGLHDDDHYTTVYDIYLMLNEALRYDEFVNIMQISVYDIQYYDKDGNELHVTLDSTDHYLTGEAEPPRNVTVLGGKTGTTAAAGNCLSIVSQNAYGQFYISIIVKALNKEDLYRDMNTLLQQING